MHIPMENAVRMQCTSPWKMLWECNAHPHGKCWENAMRIPMDDTFYLNTKLGIGKQTKLGLTPQKRRRRRKYWKIPSGCLGRRLLRSVTWHGPSPDPWWSCHGESTPHNLPENREMYDVKTVLEIIFLTIQLRHIYQQNLPGNTEMVWCENSTWNNLPGNTAKTHLSTKYSTQSSWEHRDVWCQNSTWNNLPDNTVKTHLSTKYST